VTRIVVTLETPIEWLGVARSLAMFERERRRAGLPPVPELGRLADECNEMLAAYMRRRLTQRTTQTNKSDVGVFACATLTTAQAAQRLGISPRAVQAAAKRGRLPHTVVRGDYRFRSTDVDIYAHRSTR
jgi:excisionase family DNA binding protein